MAFEAAPANTHIFRSLSVTVFGTISSSVWHLTLSLVLTPSSVSVWQHESTTNDWTVSSFWHLTLSLVLTPSSVTVWQHEYLICHCLTTWVPHLSLSDNLCLTTFSFLVVRPMAISYRPIMIIGLPRLPFPRSPTLLPILLIHHYPHLFSTMCSHYFAWVWPLSSAPDLSFATAGDMYCGCVHLSNKLSYHEHESLMKLLKDLQSICQCASKSFMTCKPNCQLKQLKS